MTKTARLFLGLAIAVTAATAAVRGQETRSSTLLTTEHYLDWERVSDAQISPDGSRIVYTRQHVNAIDDKWDSEIWILNTDGAQHRFFLKGSAARWSPDGKRLMYLAEGEPKGSQIFVRWVDVDGPATQITHVNEAPRGGKWSPDGQAIAFSMFVPEPAKWAISMPSEPKGAKWTAPPRIVDTLHFRQDQVGFIEDGTMRIFVVPADGGTARELTPSTLNAGAGELRGAASLDWTPDAKAIVFNGNRAQDADLKYESSSLFVVDVATGAIRDLVTKPGEWTRPVVSPDGRTVAFSGHAPTAHTYTVSDVVVIPLTGGASDMRKISGDFDREAINMRWAPDGSGIYFDADSNGARNIQLASIVGGVKPVTTGRHMLSFDSVSKDLVAAGISADLDHPQDVVKFSLKTPGQITKLTDVNGDVLKGMQSGKSEEVTYTSSGNAKVMGWVVKPPSFDASKKYPLILEIHGGPFGNYNVGFNYMFQNFAANGFVVLVTNPRGSTGYGTDFINGIDHNYPGPDYDDLMAGVDTVVGRGYIDASRMYVSGCSGGGVLSSWVIGHTDRFAAAAVRCPVIDWMSMAGPTHIPLFTYNFFKKTFWEEPADR